MMRSLCIFILVLLLSFTSRSEAKDITKVRPQKVVHVLQQVGNYDGIPPHVIILKDSSAWRTTSQDGIPAEGDVIESSDGSFFSNTMNTERYFLEHIGTLNKTPLCLEKIFTGTMPIPEKDFDEEFLRAFSEGGLDYKELDFKQLDKFYYLSNQHLCMDGFFDNSKRSLESWASVNAVYMIHQVETYFWDHLVCLEHHEVSPIFIFDYRPTSLFAIDLERDTITFEEGGKIWKTFSSYAELAEKWEPDDTICIHSIFDLEKIREDEEEYQDLLESREETELFALLLRLQHGIELDEQILSSWNLRMEFVMNLRNEETILVWEWIPRAS